VTLLVSPPDGPLALVDERGKIRQTNIVLGADTSPTALSPDGSVLAIAWVSGDKAGTLELREVPTGKVRRSIPRVGTITHLAFSPDGSLLAGVCGDNTVCLWNPATGESTGVCRGHQRTIRGVAFRPKGRRLLSWGDDGSVRQWLLPQGSPFGSVQGHNRPIYAGSYSNSSGLFATGGEPGMLRVWRAANSEVVEALPIDTAVHWLAFAPDDSLLVTGHTDGAIRRWPLQLLSDPRVLRGHTSYVYPVAFSPDGRWIASGGWDNVIRIWDAASGKPIRVLSGPKGFVACLAISPDGSRIVARSMDGRLRIWDTGSGDLLHDIEDVGLEDFRPPTAPGYRFACFLPQSVAISPDGAVVACGCNDRVRFWELATGQETAGLIPNVQGSIRQAVFSPNGRQLAIAATEPPLCIIDRNTGRVEHVLNGPSGPVHAVCFSPDGRRLAAAGDDRVVRIWDTTTAELQRELRGHTDQVFAVAFHPDSTRLASGGRDRVVRLWNPDSGDEMARLQGHTDYIFSLAFSPDGNTLVSGSGDSTVRLWSTIARHARQ
jgi:WD40 repeat protein